MTTLPQVASLWIGERLTYLEQLCLTSFVEVGHPTRLYTYDSVRGVPDGVEIADAGDILPAHTFIYNRGKGSPGPFSDRFRYHMLKQTDAIWVDTDAYCLRPFPASDYLFASHFKHFAANGVLRLPQDSPTLDSLIAFTEDEYPKLPPDFPYTTGQRHGGAFEGTMHISDMAWETWGPFALTHFLNQHGEMQHAWPKDALYPLPNVAMLIRGNAASLDDFPESCLSIHLYTSNLKRLIRARGMHRRSLLMQMCRTHGIDPARAPLPAMRNRSETVPAIREKRPRVRRDTLLRHVLESLETPDRDVTYVHVGANDGVLDDPVYALAQTYGWRALLIEPHPSYVSSLRALHAGNPRVRIAETAISDAPGIAQLHYLDPDAATRFPAWAHGCASFDRDRLSAQLAPHGILNAADICTVTVPIRPLRDVLAEHEVHTCDLLVVDVEGHEAQVISSVDLGTLRPRIMLIEVNTGAPVPASIKEAMAEHGYTAFRLGDDVLALAQDAPDVPAWLMLDLFGVDRAE